MMRAGITVKVAPDDRRRLEAIVSDRNALQKHVWRAKTILAMADGCGTSEIMRRSGKAKPVVWRWQARFMAEATRRANPASRRCRRPRWHRHGQNMKRHRHQEFIRFLNAIEARVPKRKAIHAVVDNYATHKHPKVREWLARHPRWTFHFTPTSASWLNAVETFFAKLTRRRLSRGVFRSVGDLKAAINRFVLEPMPNQNPSSAAQIPTASSPLSNAGNKR